MDQRGNTTYKNTRVDNMTVTGTCTSKKTLRTNLRVLSVTDTNKNLVYLKD